jgi:hypothetical protein
MASFESKHDEEQRQATPELGDDQWCSPFQQIPNELTAYILEFTHDGGWHAIVACVCHHWRQWAVNMNGGRAPKLVLSSVVSSISLLKWAIRNNLPNNGTLICMKAARGGHLEVLQWARDHGYPWD